MNKRQLTSTAKNIVLVIQGNLLANFSNRKEGEIELPSLVSRAEAIYNEDRVYEVEDLREVNGNEL